MTTPLLEMKPPERYASALLMWIGTGHVLMEEQYGRWAAPSESVGCESSALS
jgi:hypothetical protein